MRLSTRKTIIVDPDDLSTVQWDDEHRVVALRKYYTLKGEANITIQKSRQLWQDTSLSVYYAVQCTSYI
jgi:serine/arginine repetitive matrix protein 2